MKNILEQLAQKTGIQKSFMSRIENGASDIQLPTLSDALNQEPVKK